MNSDEVHWRVLASPAASGMVRDRFQRCLDAWGLPHLADDVLLCTGELVANAVAATPTAEIRVRLSRDPYGVLVEIWDPCSAMPQVRQVVQPTLDDPDLSPDGFDANGGWGLPIVMALFTACGFTPHPPDGGKTVWARFADRAPGGRPGPRRNGAG